MTDRTTRTLLLFLTLIFSLICPPGPAAADTGPAKDEPATDEPATDEPATDEPATDEPAAIEVRAPRRPPAERAARVLSWHAGYGEALREVVPPLAKIVRLLRRGDARSLTAPCRALTAAMVRLDRDAILPVPDFAADHHLRRALRRLDKATAACVERRPAALAYQIDRLEKAFDDAELALRRFGVKP